MTASPWRQCASRRSCGHLLMSFSTFAVSSPALTQAWNSSLGSIVTTAARVCSAAKPDSPSRSMSTSRGTILPRSVARRRSLRDARSIARASVTPISFSASRVRTEDGMTPAVIRAVSESRISFACAEDETSTAG